MKNLHVSIAAVLLFVPLLGTAMAQPKHPNLLFNRQELAEMKARIDKYPWARQTFERIKADAEADAANPHYNVPTRVSRWRWQPNTTMARICTIGGLSTATRSRTCYRGTST